MTTGVPAYKIPIIYFFYQVVVPVSLESYWLFKSNLITAVFHILHCSCFSTNLMMYTSVTHVLIYVYTDTS
jgi:hypothetical protein